LKWFDLVFESMDLFWQILCLLSKPIYLSLELVDSLISTQKYIIVISFMFELFKLFVDLFHMSRVCYEKVFLVVLNGLECFLFIVFDFSLNFSNEVLVFIDRLVERVVKLFSNRVLGKVFKLNTHFRSSGVTWIQRLMFHLNYEDCD
jgi:hypothetical protein